MRTTNAMFGTVITTFDTLTNGVKRIASSASMAVDAVDNVSSALRDQTDILRKWSRDLNQESDLNRDTKHQEMMLEAQIRSAKVDDALQKLMEIEQNRPEGFSEFKAKFQSEVNKYFHD